MGVRDTPSNSTMASSAIRVPPGSAPARIIARRRNCAFTVWEVPAGQKDKVKSVATYLKVRAERVIFTGYLTHHELQHLFPCCDAGIFPSIVKEAGPLVFLEALASGCFPLGTYFGGMKASIDAIAELFPPEIADAMKIDPLDTVADIVSNVSLALRFGVRYKDVLSRTAQSRYDW